ncbi:MAG TPA: WD40 repeat domain-containing protein [Candidatus Babeliales bacterium]|nr:WD40 repeat domain-containing protein [Candidatus Babeliales bacterium]
MKPFIFFSIFFWPLLIQTHVPLKNILKYEIPHPDEISDLAFHPNKNTLYAARFLHEEIDCFGLTERKLEKIGSIEGVRTIAAGPTGDLAAPDFSAAVNLWTHATGQEKRLPHSEWVIAVEFSPTDSLLASASLDKTVRLFSTTQRPSLLQRLTYYSQVRSINFSPTGKSLASASDAGVQLLDCKTLQKTTVSTEKLATTVNFSHDGHLLATAGKSGVQILDLRTPNQAYKIPHKSSVLEFSPTGKHLATAGKGKRVLVWDNRKTKKPLRKLPHQATVTTVKFSPTGKHLATGSGTNVHLWNNN